MLGAGTHGPPKGNVPLKAKVRAIKCVPITCRQGPFQASARVGFRRGASPPP
jgi:hypothetical protein